jgi:hypothetical protein
MRISVWDALAILIFVFVVVTVAGSYLIYWRDMRELRRRERFWRRVHDAIAEKCGGGRVCP